MSWDDLERTLCWMALEAASDAWLSKRVSDFRFRTFAHEYFLRWPFR